MNACAMPFPAPGKSTENFAGSGDRPPRGGPCPRLETEDHAEGDRRRAERRGHPGPEGRPVGDLNGRVRDRQPEYRGAIEYLFRWNGSETHVLQPGAHKAIIP